jgi:hypothetical protein
MNDDVTVTVTSPLAQLVLDAIDFPVLLQVPSSKIDGLGEPTIQVNSSDSHRPEDEVPELSDAFERAILEMAKRARDGAIDESAGSKDELKALQTLASVIGDKDNQDAPIYESTTDEIKEALSVIVTAKSVSVDVEWVKIEVEKPHIKLGNPIVLSDISVRVQARIKACISIFGKKYCIHVTTPRVHLEARNAFLQLLAQGPIVSALPHFEDLDIVISIKIWKWTFTIRIGITGIVNNQLKKQGPIALIDLSAFEQGIPFSSKKLKISDLRFPALPKDLEAAISMAIE